MNDHKSIFHSYTIEEAGHATRAWAMIALAACSGALAALGIGTRMALQYSYYGSTETAWAAGTIYGMGLAGVLAFFILFLRQARLSGLARKAYKKANPTLFDTAGDPLPSAPQ